MDVNRGRGMVFQEMIHRLKFLHRILHVLVSRATSFARIASPGRTECEFASICVFSLTFVCNMDVHIILLAFGVNALQWQYHSIRCAQNATHTQTVQIDSPETMNGYRVAE